MISSKKLLNYNFMYQNLFPITIIDDFYPNPDVIRNFALSQDYESDPDRNWPGKRTKDIIELDKDLHHFFVRTVLNAFYPMEYEYNADFETSFQLIESQDPDQYSPKNKGWIHHDAILFGGVVYLTKDPEPNTGTSIYLPKKGHYQHKQDWVKMKVSDCGENEEISLEEYKKVMDDQYNFFDESVTVENVYNRCFLFGGNVAHAAKTFGTRTGKDARLTQVFFCYSLISNMDTYPLCRTYTPGGYNA